VFFRKGADNTFANINYCDIINPDFFLMMKFKIHGFIRTLRYLWIVAGITLIVSSCRNSTDQSDRPVKQPIITVTGAFALYPLMEVWSAKYQEENPAVKIFLFPASSTKGNLAVVNNQADIGMFSKNPETIQNRQMLKVFPVAQDAVLVTINDKNPWKNILNKHGVKPDRLKEIFLQDKTLSWSIITNIEPGKPIFAFTRSDLCGAGQAFSEFIGATQENLAGTGVYGDPGMIQAIRNQQFSIGYDNLRYVYNNVTGCFYDGISVLPIDFNENGVVDEQENFYQNLQQITTAMKNGNYPQPLTKNLYLLLPALSPDSAAIAFVNWILRDGQQLVEKAGYVKIEDLHEILQTSNPVKQ